MTKIESKIGGVKKTASILDGWIYKVAKIDKPIMPAFIETYHLTWATIPLAVGMLLIAIFKLGSDVRWLWAIIGLVIIQHITDLYDGAVGRYRKTGLIRWGFYMDHLFDYLFAGIWALCFYFIYPQDSFFLLLIIFVSGLFFFHEALSSIVLEKKYNTSGYGAVGTVELKVVVIAVNLLILGLGAEAGKIAAVGLLVVVGGFLAFLIWRTQKRLWKLDMEAKLAK